MDDDSSFFVYNKWRNLDVTAIVKNCQSVSGLHLIVLTQLCLDVEKTFPLFCVILVAFSWGKVGGRGVKVIEERLRSIPPNPGSRGQKKPATEEQRVKRICVFVFDA